MPLTNNAASKWLDRTVVASVAGGLLVMCASFFGTWTLLNRTTPSGAQRLEVEGFARGGTGVKLLGKGWSPSESWGTWSEGPVSEIRWPLHTRPSSDVHFWIDARIYPHFSTPPQSIGVIINGTKVATLERNFEGGLYGGSFWAGMNVVAARNPVHIEFAIANPTAPASIQDGGDPRKLGIGLKSIEISYKGD